MRALPPKLVPEVITVEFNFADVMLWAEDINAATVSLELFSGRDASPEDMISGSAVITGNRVSQKITGGRPGSIYIVVCVVEGSSGASYQKSRNLAVLSEDGSYVASSTPTLTGTLPDATPGVPYSNNLFIEGGYPPYEFDDVVAGSAPPWMGFSVDGNYLVCAGLPDETVSTSYTFTPQIQDAVNNRASSAQVVDVNLIEIFGDIASGIKGSAVSGAYTQTGGVEPVTYTVASGTFPPGVTLNSDGTYSGTFTTKGDYSWVIRGEDAVGNVGLLNDSCSVYYYAWLMARGQSQLMYITEDVVNGPWDTTTRKNSSIYINQFIPTQTNFNEYVIWGSTGGARVYYSNDVDPTDDIDSSIVTIFYYPNQCLTFDGIVIIPFSNANGYSLSLDSGKTFVSQGVPVAGVNITGFARLDTGRWLVAYGDGSDPAGVAYTDAEIPYASADWTAVPFSGNTDAGVGFPIACTGTAACVVFNTGKVYRTTTGTSWTLVQEMNPDGSYSSRRAAIGFKDNIMIICCDQTGTYIRSTDNGNTWEEMTNSVTDDPIAYFYADGVLLALGTDISYSLDDGNSFQALPLPFTPGYLESVGVAPVLAGVSA